MRKNELEFQIKLSIFEFFEQMCVSKNEQFICMPLYVQAQGEHVGGNWIGLKWNQF